MALMHREMLPDLFTLLPSALIDDTRMKIEEYRDGDTLVVRAELPGIDPDEDVEITVDDGMLTIHGQRSETTESDTAEGFRSEFHYGSFSRSLRLPAGATEDDVTASYTDGILEVRVPVSEERAAATKVPVTRA